jgi:hypothetical protein
MMMAFNRDQSPPPALSEETVARLRAALVSYVIDGEHTASLHDALCAAAQEARTRGIMAERLLITLKESWHSIPEVRAADDGASHAQVLRLQRLITRCIEAYYE